MQREKTYSTKPEQNQNIHNQYAFLFVQNMYHCPTGNLESYLTLGEMTDLLQMHREKIFLKKNVFNVGRNDRTTPNA